MKRLAWRAPSLRRRRQLFVAALLLALWLALRPAAIEPPLLDHLDKLRHLGCFAVLALLGLWAGLRPAWVVSAGLFVFGVLIELAQSLAPTRSTDPLDLLANLLGIVLGLLLWTAGRAWWFNRPPASQTPLAGASQTAAASDASRPR